MPSGHPGNPPAYANHMATAVIAHRGFSGRWPENTAPAFLAAIDAGADMIELDARRTAGEAVAVVHDDDLGRYGHHGRRVSDLDLDILRQLDAGAWFDPRFAGTRFLGLGEALTSIGGQVPVNVEIKVDPGQEPHIEALVTAALAEIAAAGSPPVLFSTFSMTAFRRLRALAPQIPAALLLGAVDDPLRSLPELIELGAEGVHVPRVLAGRPLIEAAHARRLKVRVYTINEPSVMAELIDLGVDGLFTDWPDRLLGLVGLLGRAGLVRGGGNPHSSGDAGGEVRPGGAPPAR